MRLGLSLFRVFDPGIEGALLCLTLGASLVAAQNGTDPLKAGFENPPEGARPRVWWHWMNGNITKEGIKLDLEWMHRAGLGGFQNFDASLFTPQLVEKRLVYMTPEWKDAFKYATVLADQLGLEEAIAGSPGWSETGGPWVPAKEAMKKYVWSETRMEGGKPFTGTLPHPPSNTGAFQNLPVEDLGDMLGGAALNAPEYYADSAVIAYKEAATDVPLESLQPKITTSSGSIDPLSARRWRPGEDGRAPDGKGDGRQGLDSIRIREAGDDPRPHHRRLAKKAPMDAFLPPGGDSGKALEASDDGQNFHVVVDVPKGGSTEHTLSFAPVTAKYFRVTFKTHARTSQSFRRNGHAKRATAGDRSPDCGTGAASRRARKSL